MSDLSVRAKALADEATPGPWLPVEDEYGDEWWFGGGGEGQVAIGMRNGVTFVAGLYLTDPETNSDAVRTTAAFIAEFRELVPALAAEVERLEELVGTAEDDYRTARSGDRNQIADLKAGLAKVTAHWAEKERELVGRNEQLQAELDEIIERWQRCTEEREQLVAALREVIAEIPERGQGFWANYQPVSVERAEALLASLEDSP